MCQPSCRKKRSYRLPIRRVTRRSYHSWQAEARVKPVLQVTVPRAENIVFVKIQDRGLLLPIPILPPW